MSDTDIAQSLFRDFKFEPGTGFTVDFVQYPETATGTSNVALRAYSNTFDRLSQKNRLLITEQLSRLIQDIRQIGVNCILEVWDAPGKPGRTH